MSSPSSRIWIRLDVVLAVHEAVIAEHGGSLGLRDLALLESALARPRQADTYAEAPLDARHLAALYGLAITRNHPFVDGNKRVALVVFETFLNLNVHELVAGDADIVSTMWALAAGEMTDAEFVAWAKRHVRHQPPKP